MTETRVYDIRKCKIYVDGVEIVDAGEGIGITPKGGENKPIETPFGEVGFSLDPSTACEVTISLAATSPSNDKMRAIAAAKKVVPVSIKSEDHDATGFEEISADYVIFKPAEKKLAKEAPTYEYKGTGFGFNEK